ncbi:hypothetical protein CVT24_009724 [Panaeolus cyanescens]|uniref:DBF4-type domain-containing protein n=1 Tax=Panaeolus cyanescens TaxID=181874 RepID=A0A409Y9X6_9AGAR|nr:hypothetical protein CVT24_009724 [Panaeolus cyanescens]
MPVHGRSLLNKRPRSPDTALPEASSKLKRARPPLEKEKEKEKQKEKGDDPKKERYQREIEFREKYCKEFPKWSFHLDNDIDPQVVKQLKAKTLKLGGKIDPFFSSSITHLITTKPIPKEDGVPPKDKENVSKSPAKLPNSHPAERDMVSKAQEWGMKVWSVSKFESVLARCLPSQVPSRSLVVPPKQSLQQLLRTEKYHGTTECDPTAKKANYRYFTKGSHFVLIEDIRGEVATLAAHEYPPFKEEGGKKPWPVLYCHPLARNPFIPFDDKEKRRWERTQQAEKEHERERDDRKKQRLHLAVMKRKAAARFGQKDLRRCASMNMLHRRHSYPAQTKPGGYVDLDADDDSLDRDASGLAGSIHYDAASGNSVSITSNLGTTSTTGQQLSRRLPLAPAITERMQRHVLTSRKAPNRSAVAQQPTLKKSKSTNTLKLPKREEGMKPGYCESCRIKFEDFTEHIASKKHQKFASDASNFTALDEILFRIRRRTVEEAEADELQAIERVM